MMLQGKVAIVTGGTRGIGLAIVRTYLQNGAKVALFGSREETVNKALDELKAENAGWEVIGMAPDLTDYAAVKAAVDVSARWTFSSTTRASRRVSRSRRMSPSPSSASWI